jgi:hypothetical protein
MQKAIIWHNEECDLLSFAVINYGETVPYLHVVSVTEAIDLVKIGQAKAWSAQWHPNLKLGELKFSLTD